MARRRTIALLALLFGAAGLVFLALGAADLAEDSPPAKSAAAARPKPAATAAKPAAKLEAAKVPRALRAAIAKLSRAQQVAQLFLVGFEGTDATVPFFAELAKRPWGGVLMTPDNVLSPDQGAALAASVTIAARDAGVPRPLVAASGVAGFEPPVQSAGDRPAAVRAAARAKAEQLQAAGFTLTLAPVADVSIEGDDGTFGDDPAAVAALTAAAVSGWRASGVVAAPGRFPGEGTTSQDPLEGPATIGLSADELEGRDLVPYRRLRAPAVVVSSAAFSAYDPVTPASLTPAITRGLLRAELGFRGVAVSDDLAGAAAATGAGAGDTAVAALQAGIDLLQVSDPEARDAAYAAVLAAAERGTIPAARLQEALVRVLTLKRDAGLLDVQSPG